MEQSALHVWLKWIHLVATAAWIGGMMANLVVYLPLIRKQLDPKTSGRLMGAVMGRFKWLVYSCIGVLMFTGVMLVTLQADAEGPMRVGDTWFVYFFGKLFVFMVMVILTVYAFEGLAPAVARAASEGPSPKLGRLQRRQGMLALIAFVLGLLILWISAAL
jgi:putative copper export protein